jgi:hypothetical protein
VAVAIVISDEALTAAPVVAVTKWTSPWIAFGSMVVPYSAIGFLLSMAVDRAYTRFSTGRPTRFETWINRQISTRRGALGRRIFGTGRIIGFVGSSVLLGGPLTILLARLAGRRQRIRPLALVSSLIFAIGFVALYTGIAVVVLN